MLAKSTQSTASSNGKHAPVSPPSGSEQESAESLDPSIRWRSDTATLRVALLVNLARNAPPVHRNAPPDILAELDQDKNVDAYAAAMRAQQHEVTIQEGNAHLAAWLERVQPDICFNTCEGFGGDSREAQVPALLEMLGLPYTGPTPLAAAITHDKPTTQRILYCHGLPVPRFQAFHSPDDALHADMQFPLFVKPAHEGTGMGIRNESIVRNEQQLREQVARTIELYRQAAMVESYIEGKDITCGLVGNGDDVHFFPITEVDFSGYPPELEPIYGIQQKVDYDTLYRNKCPAPLGDALSNEIRRLTHEVFRITGCRDFARVDFRLDANNQPYILEINALPGITPHSDLTLMAEAEGWTHADLVCAVLDAGLKRYGLKK
jgi:D-alanine-D-alanine ligase